MKNYFIFGAHLETQPPRDLIAISDNFSWSAALISPIWFLWRGMWIHALAMCLVLAGLFAFGLNTTLPVLTLLLGIVVSIGIGFEARFLYIEFLARQGFELKRTILADNPKIAELVYLSSFQDGDLAHVQNPVRHSELQSGKPSTDMIFSRNWDS